MKKLNAIEKAFAILEGIVSRPDSGLSFSEIACRHKFPISSTHRILRTLTRTGYISYDKNAKKYRATLKLPSLGARVVESFNLYSHVQPYLEDSMTDRLKPVGCG